MSDDREEVTETRDRTPVIQRSHEPARTTFVSQSRIKTSKARLNYTARP